MLHHDYLNASAAIRDELKQARDEVDEDDAHWTRLATGQDTEEAEHSGYLSGYADGLAKALDLLPNIAPKPRNAAQ